MEHRIILAGFGGQGVLLMGQLLAKAAIAEDREVTWMPSYGAETRGGTSNCHVVIADEEIGTPVVSRATECVAMNLPSLDKFEDAVAPGGTIFVNSSLIERKVARGDITAVYVPATGIADELGNTRVANMVMLGALLGAAGEGLPAREPILEALRQTLGAKREHLVAINKEALEKGAECALPAK